MGVEKVLPFMSVLLGFILTLCILKLVVIVNKVENKIEDYKDNRKFNKTIRLTELDEDGVDSENIKRLAAQEIKKMGIDDDAEIVVLFSIAFFLVIAFTVVTVWG